MSEAPGKKQAHVFLFDAVTINQFYYGVWAQKSDRRVDFKTPEYWALTAKLCERGKLDGIFFADLAAAPNTHRDSYDPAGRDGAFFPAYDPLLVAGIIAAEHHRPRHRRHRADHLDAPLPDRALVLHARPPEPRPGGLEHRLLQHPGGGARLRPRASAHLRRVLRARRRVPRGRLQALGGVVGRGRGRRRQGGARLRAARTRSTRSATAATTSPSTPRTTSIPAPQRLPVLAQASGTARGTAFAAKNAELILVGGPTRAYCAENIRGIHAAAAEAGRAPGSVKTTALVDVIVGPTREAARAKAEEYDSFITLEGALAFAESRLNPEEHADDVALADLVAVRGDPGDRRRRPLLRRPHGRRGEGELPLPAPAPPRGRHAGRSRRRDRILARRRRRSTRSTCASGTASTRSPSSSSWSSPSCSGAAASGPPTDPARRCASGSSTPGPGSAPSTPPTATATPSPQSPTERTTHRCPASASTPSR